MCSTYLRSKYQKLGFNFSDVKRITNPLNSQFRFVTDDRDVQVMSAKDVLSPYHYDRLLKFHKAYPIKKGSCHSTAGFVAFLLRDAGVQVCDGYYYDKMKKETYAHTFCKLGDLYFDPTIEFAFSSSFISCFDYHSVRLYEPNEYKVIQHAFYYAVKGGVNSYATSTIRLGYDKDSGQCYEIRLDDRGMIELWSSNCACAA